MEGNTEAVRRNATEARRNARELLLYVQLDLTSGGKQG
jgi:hypothetical protein